MMTNSQKERCRVYIDATIPSYLISKLSDVPQTAEWQRITHEFWRDNRFEFILSDLVITEISIGDRSQAAGRLQAIEGLRVVDVLDLERGLARKLVAEKAIPEIALSDAVHVAAAAIHAIPYLATWNFAHLANPYTKPKIEQVCRDAGYSPPRIQSPKAILEELS